MNEAICEWKNEFILQDHRHTEFHKLYNFFAQNVIKMPNKVINSTLIKSITKNGNSFALKYATQTETWNRTYLTQSVKDDFSNAIEKADVPANAASATLA